MGMEGGMKDWGASFNQDQTPHELNWFWFPRPSCFVLKLVVKPNKDGAPGWLSR